MGIFSFFFSKNESSRSPKWPWFRTKWVEKNPFCCGCGTLNNIQVHHIVPFNVDKSKELDINNVMSLCKTCHFVFGHLNNYNYYNVNVVVDCATHISRVHHFGSRVSKFKPLSFWRILWENFLDCFA